MKTCKTLEKEETTVVKTRNTFPTLKLNCQQEFQ